MKTKHTPEDWKAYGYEVRQPGGRMIADFGPHHTEPSEYPLSCRLEDEANAQRAVACVNACKGINPEALRDLLNVALKVVQNCTLCLGGHVGRTLPTGRDTVPCPRCASARAAINLATGQQ